MSKTWIEGQRVYIDTDDPQWGRVASKGTVIEVRTKDLLISADSIRANISVAKRDVFEE